MFDKAKEADRIVCDTNDDQTEITCTLYNGNKEVGKLHFKTGYGSPSPVHFELDNIQAFINLLKQFR